MMEQISELIHSHLKGGLPLGMSDIVLSNIMGIIQEHFLPPCLLILMSIALRMFHLEMKPFYLKQLLQSNSIAASRGQADRQHKY